MQINNRTTEKDFNKDYYTPPGFIGTAEYHQVTLSKRFIATDGAAFVFEEQKCYWLSDVLASYMKRYDTYDSYFYVVDVVVDLKKNSCDVVITDGNRHVIANQHIGFTDLQKNLRFYIAQQDTYWVCMLPSEY